MEVASESLGGGVEREFECESFDWVRGAGGTEGGVEAGRGLGLVVRLGRGAEKGSIFLSGILVDLAGASFEGRDEAGGELGGRVAVCVGRGARKGSKLSDLLVGFVFESFFAGEDRGGEKVLVPAFWLGAKVS